MHAAKSSARPEMSSLIRRQRYVILLGAVMAIMTMLAAPVAQATGTATTTTLSLSSSSVSSGTAVTLTAAVSNGSPVTTGLVTFCDFATATYCENSALHRDGAIDLGGDSGHRTSSGDWEPQLCGCLQRDPKRNDSERS